MEHPPLTPARYPSLDYLRGLMALSVLVFHFDKWLNGSWDAATLQGKLGVYAVSIFFVLSGLTLTLVYEARLDWTARSWAKFYKKRIFRIYPLLWLATAATLFIEETLRPCWVTLLNFTGLFGFVNPARDIATGAWSIGCELVFYAAFPTLLLMAQRSKTLLIACFAALCALGAWAAFAWFSPAQSEQSAWWEAYVQVANHAFFFVGGMAIGALRNGLSAVSPLFWRLALAAAVGIFVCWPVGHEPFWLVSGWNRLVLSTLALAMVLACFKGDLTLKGRPHLGLAWLGAISYSLYLWHPLVFRGLRSAFERAGIEGGYWVLFVPALVGSLALSHFSYFFLEAPLSGMRKP